MATKTPAQPARPFEGDPKMWEAIERRSTTESRAVNPPSIVEHRSLAHKDFGEAHLVWQCDDCGAVGSLTAFPSVCPDCSAAREALYYYTED